MAISSLCNSWFSSGVFWVVIATSGALDKKNRQIQTWKKLQSNKKVKKAALSAAKENRDKVKTSKKVKKVVKDLAEGGGKKAKKAMMAKKMNE